MIDKKQKTLLATCLVILKHSKKLGYFEKDDLMSGEVDRCLQLENEMIKEALYPRPETDEKLDTESYNKGYQAGRTQTLNEDRAHHYLWEFAGQAMNGLLSHDCNQSNIEAQALSHAKDLIKLLEAANA